MEQLNGSWLRSRLVRTPPSAFVAAVPLKTADSKQITEAHSAKPETCAELTHSKREATGEPAVN